MVQQMQYLAALQVFAASDASVALRWLKDRQCVVCQEVGQHKLALPVSTSSSIPELRLLNLKQLTDAMFFAGLASNGLYVQQLRKHAQHAKTPRVECLLPKVYTYAVLTSCFCWLSCLIQI